MDKRYLPVLFLAVFFSLSVPVFSQGQESGQKSASSQAGKVLVVDGNGYRTVQDVPEASSCNVSSAKQESTQATRAALEQKIKADASIMDSIRQLAQDPQVLAILADPEVKNAVMHQDVESLKNNEKFLKFMENPAVKKITQEAMTSQNNETTKQ